MVAIVNPHVARRLDRQLDVVLILHRGTVPIGLAYAELRAILYASSSKTGMDAINIVVATSYTTIEFDTVYITPNYED